MGEGNLELKIVAAERLKNVSILGKGKISPYAVAWIDPQLKKSTRTLQNSGTCPAWNDTLVFPIHTQLFNNPNAAFIIQVLCASPLKTKIIGTTTLMLSEIKRICSITGRDENETFTLQLWRPSGRAYGILKVALKLKGSDLFEAHDVPTSWATTNPQAPNWPVTNPPQPCDVPVQGIPVASLYPQVAPPTAPLYTMDDATSDGQCGYSYASHPPAACMPFPPTAVPLDAVDYSISNDQCGYPNVGHYPSPTTVSSDTVEYSTSNEQCVYPNAPQSPSSQMPLPPTAPHVKQSEASKNFLIGLLSGAVAAVLVGSAVM